METDDVARLFADANVKPTKIRLAALEICRELADPAGNFKLSTVCLARRLWGDEKAESHSSLANRALRALAKAGLLQRTRPAKGRTSATWRLLEVQNASL